MAYQLSPGVTWTEIDLTTIVPSVATTEGAFAGNFEWGPIDDVRIISSEIDLVRFFHKPSAVNFRAWFTAANFLSYTSNLKLVRAANNTSRNATSSSGVDAERVLIKNQDEYEIQYLDLSATSNVGMFAARYAGSLGNDLKVSLCAANNDTSFTAWTYAEEFDSRPGTSAYVAERGGANDEMHLIVIDTKGVFSGVANTILEKFPFVSKAVDAKNDDGSSNYYVNVINDRSEFIYIMNHAQDDETFVSATSTWGQPAANLKYTQVTDTFTRSLTGGVSAQPTNGDHIRAYDIFKNAEEYDISLVMTGAAAQVVSEHVVENIAEYRKDCVVFISPEYADAVNNLGDETNDIIDFRNQFNSSSYAVMDSGWKKQFDKYNNVYRWVPLNGDIAGLCARTDFERDPWFSPAGFNRGQIKNSVKLAWTPNKAQRDELYKNGINPVVEFKGEGTVLYGDKTLLAKPSAFDRINVRRLFIVLEKAISKAAKYSLFEFNDEFTRAQFVALIEPYLRDVKGRRGIFDFKVVCDETNNTPEVIDRNEFVGDIYIKPARSINFIYLNFVAVRTGVAFSEVVGKF
jgi:oxalate decarboxylase/phosphoglucose isomerase-like protein (cupin superfamily)